MNLSSFFTLALTLDCKCVWPSAVKPNRYWPSHDTWLNIWDLLAPHNVIQSQEKNILTHGTISFCCLYWNIKCKRIDLYCLLTSSLCFLFIYEIYNSFRCKSFMLKNVTKYQGEFKKLIITSCHTCLVFCQSNSVITFYYITNNPILWTIIKQIWSVRREFVAHNLII